MFVIKKYLIVCAIRYKRELTETDKQIIRELGPSFQVDYDRSLNEILACEKSDDLFEKLKPFTKVSAEVKEEHIKSIQETKENMVCPKCGGQLVLRTAKQGANAGKQFYGCSNFPKCRYIRNY